MEENLNPNPNPESPLPAAGSVTQTTGKVLHVVLLEQLRPSHKLQHLAGYSAPRLYHWGLTLTPATAFVLNVQDRDRLAGPGTSWHLDGVLVTVWFHYTDGYVEPKVSHGRGGLRSGQPKLNVPVWSVVVLGDAPMTSFASLQHRLRRLPLSTFMKEGDPTPYVNPQAHGPANKLFASTKVKLTPEILGDIPVFLTKKQMTAQTIAADREAARTRALELRNSARLAKKADREEKKRARNEKEKNRQLLAVKKRRKRQRQLNKRVAASKRRQADRVKTRQALLAKKEAEERQRLLKEEMRQQIRAELEEETKEKALAEARGNFLANQVREQIRAELMVEMEKKHKARTELEAKIRREKDTYSSPTFTTPTNPVYKPVFRPPTPMPMPQLHQPMFAPPPPPGLVRYDTPPMHHYGPRQYGGYMY